MSAPDLVSILKFKSSPHYGEICLLQFTDGRNLEFLFPDGDYETIHLPKTKRKKIICNNYWRYHDQIGERQDKLGFGPASFIKEAMKLSKYPSLYDLNIAYRNLFGQGFFTL